MSVFGPRLDRPSVVGDEGRARAASLTVASLVLAGFAVAVTQFAPVDRPLRTAASGVALVGAGIALLDRDSIASLAVGHLCFLPGGVLAIGGIASTLLSGPGQVTANLLVVLGITAGMLGLVGGWANALDGASTARAVKQGWGASVVPIVALVVFAILGGSLWLFVRVLVEPALFPTAGPALSGLCFLVALLAGAVRLALAQLPARQVLSRERFPEPGRTVGRWQRGATAVAMTGFAGWIVLGALELSGLAATGYEALPDSLVAFLGVTATPWLRVPLLSVAILALAVALVVRTLRFLTRDFETRSVRLLAPLFGGGALVCLVLPLLTVFLLSLQDASVGTVAALLALLAIAFVLVTVAALFFVVLISVVPVLQAVNLLPDRAGGPALASAGLLLASVGVGLGSAPAPLVFAGVAGSMVAWDVSGFGLGLTRELGHLPETRRLELLHAILSLGVALLGVAVVAGLLALTRTVAPRGRLVAAMLLSVAGVLVVSIAFRE